IGLTSAKKIVAEAQIDPTTRVRDLAETEISKLRSVIENNYNVEGDLRRELAMSIRRLIEIGSYRGMRHRRGLPCRGQRTKTNARMRKGPKRTVSAKRKK
ncbi:MAG: 30S ribosomal protein S13, partial [Abditibacteriota bacterium]|nr:30S ribosomal protein S13 [Abditibacteriota bacterium]